MTSAKDAEAVNIEEAQRRLDWCMEKVGVRAVKAQVDGYDSDKETFQVSFHKAGKARGVLIRRSWLRLCNPAEDRISPEVKSLLKGIYSEARKIK